MPRLTVALLLLATSLPARASNVTNELSVARTESTPDNPRAGNVSDSLHATFNVSDQWSFSVGGAVTLEGQTAAAQQGAFGSSGGTVTRLSAGLDWDKDDHLSFGTTVDFSPQSTQNSGTQVSFTDAQGRSIAANGLLKATASQASLAFDVGYDTAGDSDLEWSFGASVTGNHFDSVQNVAEVRTASGAIITKQQLKDSCQKGKCAKGLLGALRETPATLNSAELSLTGTATLSQDTDLALGVDYYGYSEDPTQIGYFSVASAGRTTISGGNGIPIAPLRFVVRPDVEHRFGAFSAKLWVQAGQYVASTGQSTTGAGLKLQYKLSKAFRLWLTLSGQRDVSEDGSDSKSGSTALGAGYRF